MADEHEQQWWHVFGGEIPDMAVDADGNPSPAWGALTVGPAGRGADDEVREMTFPMSAGGEAHYLATFDHEPTEAEKDALAPEKYRDLPSEQVWSGTT